MIGGDRNSLWWDAYRRVVKNRLAVASFIVIMIYGLLALLASFELILPQVHLVDHARGYEPPSWEHPLGTDIFGRDVLSRAVYGIKTAMMVGLVATLISILFGVTLGAVAGYFGGKIDEMVVWLYTTIDSVPFILLVPALAFVMERGIKSLVIAMGVTSWVGLCRLIRGEFLKHRQKDYVLAAEALGASHLRRIFRHILPNVFYIILIQFSLGFVFAIKSEVILSYLGLGAEPGTPSWGLMIDDAKLELARGVWWGLAAATLFMFFLILSFNLFNDALRDALDPKLKNK